MVYLILFYIMYLTYTKPKKLLWRKMLRSGSLSLGVLVQSPPGMFKLYIVFFSYLNITEFSKLLRMKVSPLRHHARPVSSTEALPTLSLEDIHPQGSSCTTGGILRGHAAASYYSPADEENMTSNTIEAVKLTAKIYMSNLDPLNLNHDNMVPSSKVKIVMNPNIGLILDDISQRYPAIKGIYLF